MNQIVLVNCLDYLYGHCLLKLFNVDQHLNKNEDVVVIVPKFLVWAVPKQVAEIWEVDLSLRQMKEYYPDLNMQLGKQLSRFNTVYLSKAFSHPNLVNIENFTAVKPHDFSSNKYRVSFIWREDRPWFFSFPISFLARKYSGMKMLLLWQNWKIRRVFSYLSKNIPEANFTVIGIGKSTNFPDWIQDLRVEKPNQQQEKLLCQAYAESRVVIGVHGSSLLLPSAHAGAVIDLLPDDRLNNFAQDVMYHSVETEADPRLLSFRYRYLPISVSPSTVARQVTSIVKNYQNAKKYFHLGFEKNNH